MGCISYADLINRAICGVAQTEEMSEADLKEYICKDGPNTPTISVPGGFVFTTADGLAAIHELGRLWRSESADRKRRLNSERAAILAAEVFGEALAAGAFKTGTDPREAKKKLRRRLEDRLAAVEHDVVHTFPCHILDDTSIGEFDVGPVRFWPRLVWLDYAERIEGRKADWVKYLREAWTKNVAPPEGKTLHECYVRIIHSGFGFCKWAATVTISGNDIGRSKERAHTATRLAVDALGVVLNRRDALNLRGPGDELRPRAAVTIMHVPKKSISLGQSLDLPRLGGRPGFAKSYLDDTKAYRDATGKAIDPIVAVKPSGSIPRLRQTWCDALFWFGEARRDPTDFMALVRYGMSLDVLTQARQERGITCLLAALFGMRPNDTFLTDGKTLAKAAERIYNARSQLGHGGRPALLEDLPFSRASTDMIAALALQRYVMCLSHYTGTDCYEKFLGAIPEILPRLLKPTG